MQTQRCQCLRAVRDCLFDRLAVGADRLLAALLHLGDDGEPVTGRCPGKEWAVASPLEFEIALLRDGHRRRLAPVTIDPRHLGSPVRLVRSTGHYRCCWRTNPYRRRQCRVGDDRFVAVHPPGSVNPSSTHRYHKEQSWLVNLPPRLHTGGRRTGDNFQSSPTQQRGQKPCRQPRTRFW